MKLNFINEAKLNDSQLRTVDKLIRRLNDMKKGDYKEKHGGWGTYRNLTKYLSEIENSLYNTQELEIYGIPPTILKLTEKYPESVQMLKDKFKVVNPATGGIEEFYFENMRNETKGKTKLEDKMITMLRNRQGYRTLKNYVNYLKKLGFAGTKSLELNKLRLRMPNVTLIANFVDRMHGVTSDGDSFAINGSGEYLRVEELIGTVNEVQLAASAIGVDIKDVFVNQDNCTFYTLDAHQLRMSGFDEIGLDSNDVESVQDAYKAIKLAIKDAEFAANFPQDE